MRHSLLLEKANHRRRHPRFRQHSEQTNIPASCEGEGLMRSSPPPKSLVVSSSFLESTTPPFFFFLFFPLPPALIVKISRWTSTLVSTYNPLTSVLMHPRLFQHPVSYRLALCLVTYQEPFWRGGKNQDESGHLEG
ncbi:hypothetical protein CGRA01v4_10101 [Colletotrichum graminicola]|nr:hypothetical protein CGRA01v4_10101 [Colletotrichum graminicola]